MIKVSAIHDILESMYPLRNEMVPLFIGPPGIGKTQGIYEFAKEIGVNVVTFILSNTIPSEVSGIRMPDKDSKKMEVFDDMRMANLKDGDILFFDELLEAPPMLWSACLTLIQDRIMASGRKLPNVMIVAASNKVASPGIIPASTRDRFMTFEVALDWDDWVKWFEDRYGIEPDRDLKQSIQSDSDQYNILTPRKICKMYEWMKMFEKQPAKLLFARRMISAMFDDNISNDILRMVSAAKSPRRQIKEALHAIDVDMPDGYESMSFKDILESLQAMDEWPMIADRLGNIKFEGKVL